MNIHNSISPYFAAIAFCSTLILSACDSGDSAPANGSLSLNIADAPVDKADAVVVEFTGVEIQSAGGERINFDFTDRCTDDPTTCQIDLLNLTNGASQTILDGETVPSGRYNWLRLVVNAVPNVKDSYITISGQEYELTIPGGAGSRLKLNNGFVVPAGGEASFTIDFDLRKSVHDPVGNPNSDYILRPTLRMVDDSQDGSISGSVNPGFFSSGTCTGAVYVFSDGSVDAPDDEDGEGFGPDPITSTLVPDDGSHAYKVAHLEKGDYLIAFTCDAEADDPAVDEDSSTVGFLTTATVSVSANGNTVFDINP